MRLATLRLPDGATTAAVTVDDGYQTLPWNDIGAFLRSGQDLDLQMDGMFVAAEAAVLAPPVLEPSKVICAGLNYRAHILEMGRGLPEHPTIFTKHADTLTGAADPVELPVDSDSVDWEAELAVVVGTELRHADDEEAAAGIAGYTVANDISMRDWQYRTTQWQQGKMFDASTPIGPVMVTPDEFSPESGARIRTILNGEVLQDATVDDLLFPSSRLLSYISGFTRLRPGDIVLTGTPGGVGAGRVPPRYLAPGDVLVTSIAGIGELTTPILRARGSRP